MNSLIKKYFYEATSLFKTLFLNGLFAIFPLSVTIFCITFLYNILVHWLEPLRKIEPEILQNIPGAEIFIIVFAIFCIGILVKYFVVGPIIHYIEKIVAKIPLVSTIHSSLKALGDFLSFNDSSDAIERKVVLVNFPRKEYYNIAFIMGTASSYQSFIDKASHKKNEQYFRVFLPTSPVPGHGFFIILPESEIIETNFSFEEAMKITVSCGLISPSIQHDTNVAEKV